MRGTCRIYQLSGHGGREQRRARARRLVSPPKRKKVALQARGACRKRVARARAPPVPAAREVLHQVLMQRRGTRHARWREACKGRCRVLGPAAPAAAGAERPCVASLYSGQGRRLHADNLSTQPQPLLSPSAQPAWIQPTRPPSLWWVAQRTRGSQMTSRRLYRARASSA